MGKSLRKSVDKKTSVNNIDEKNKLNELKWLQNVCSEENEKKQSEYAYDSHLQLIYTVRITMKVK